MSEFFITQQQVPQLLALAHQGDPKSVARLLSALANGRIAGPDLQAFDLGVTGSVERSVASKLADVVSIRVDRRRKRTPSEG